MAGINRKKAAALLEQCRLHLERGEAAKAVEVLAPVADEDGWPDGSAVALLAEALTRTGELPRAREVVQRGLERFPKDVDLFARLGSVELAAGRPAEAVTHFARAKARYRREPAFLTHYALALLRAGQVDAAEAELTVALLCGGGGDSKLVMAMCKAHRGRLEDGQALAEQVEKAAKDPALAASAKAVRADCLLMRGDAAGALTLWKELSEAKRLDPSSLAHMAYAAQQVGESALAKRLVDERLAAGASAEDRLLFAQIANLRQEPSDALLHLDAAEHDASERTVGWRFEAAAARARALRLLGRRDEARTFLDLAAEQPEAQLPRWGARVHVDRGHLAAEQGEFERADEEFGRALALDPDDPEARRAKSLTQQRLAWREALTASAEAKVEAARAEAEALARNFRSRESELEQLKRELERLRAQTADAEHQVRRAQEDAQAQAAKLQAEQDRRLREEFAAREAEADEKAEAVLGAALGDGRAYCPPSLWQVLLVAEKTYQRAIFTELPAAAVVVLYTGALERALVVLLVAEFGAWLDAQGRRPKFLDGAVRERRGARVEYFDHFAEALDKQLANRPPSLGEVARVLARLSEPYLAPFAEFLEQRYTLPRSFWEELGEFVSWAKDGLRDPAAHGRGVELGYDTLKRFRERLLVGSAGAPSFLTRLFGARR